MCLQAVGAFSVIIQLRRFAEPWLHTYHQATAPQWVLLLIIGHVVTWMWRRVTPCHVAGSHHVTRRDSAFTTFKYHRWEKSTFYYNLHLQTALLYLYLCCDNAIMFMCEPSRRKVVLEYDPSMIRAVLCVCVTVTCEVESTQLSTNNAPHLVH